MSITIFGITVETLGLVIITWGLMERDVVELTSNVLFGTSVDVVVDGIDTVAGFVIKFVIGADVNVDVMFEGFTVFAVMFFSIIIVSFCPFLGVVITGIE